MINPAKNFLNTLRSIYENTYGPVSNETFANNLGITKGQFDRYMYRDSPIFGLGSSTLEKISQKIYNDIKSGNNWIDEKTFITFLNQYVSEEEHYIRKDNLEIAPSGRGILEWIGRKFCASHDSYTTLDFIKDIINEFNLQHKELSILFDKEDERYIDNLKQRIRNPDHPNYNPDFKFSLDDLNLLNENIISNQAEEANKLNDFIDRYTNLNNDIKEYTGQQYHLYHPNLNAHFFENINTSIKAYWLGFFCADGYIHNNRYGNLGIGLSLKDKDHLLKFCEAIGLEYTSIKEREITRAYNGELVTYYSAVINFWCKPLYEDLIRHNFKGFPNLNNYNLYLAWLLGLYDGDGFQGKTMVCSGIKILLEQIKDFFNIRYEVREYYYDSDLGYHIRITEDIEKASIKRSSRFIYILTLGSQLFNQMMNNYYDSLERKRNIFSELHETYEKLIEHVVNRANLQNLINKNPKNKLINLLNTTEYALDKLINEWDLKRSWDSL